MHHAQPSLARQPQSPTAQDQRVRNRNLQWLRAVAAIFVVLYHASIHMALILEDHSFLRVFDGRFGLVGVAIFFAISGYLMAEILPRVDPWRFLLHRVLRIYPIFFIVLLALLLIRNRLEDIDLWAMTLVPVGEGRIYYLGVEWTLLFETTFYVFLFFCSLAGLRKSLPLIACLWLTVTAFGTYMLADGQSNLTPTIDLLPLMAVNSAFAGGLLIPYLRQRNVFQPAVAMLGVGFVLLCGVFTFGIDRWLASIVAVFIVGLVASQGDPTVARTIWFSRLADRYGDWSYALYLCHAPIIVALYLKHPPIPNLVLWVLAVLTPLLVAIPFGLLDIALYRRLKTWIDSGGRSLSITLAGLYVGSFAVIAATASIMGTKFTASPVSQPIANTVAPPAETAVPTLVPDPAAPPPLAPSPSLP